MTTKITSANLDNLPNLIDWQSVVVADGSTGLTAESGKGYFINTTGGAITVTLPASPSIGDTIGIVDYASTFSTNNVTLDPGSNKIEADTTDGTLGTSDTSMSLVFTDSTQGWKSTNATLTRRRQKSKRARRAEPRRGEPSEGGDKEKKKKKK